MTIANDIRFSKERYEKYDGMAKDVATEWLTQMGFSELSENMDEANRKFRKIWDMRGQHPDLGEWRIEAEIKQDWGTKWLEMPFKYPTMDIPFRKRDKTEQHATHMMVIGGDLKRLFVVNREVMLNSPKSYKKCRNRGWAEEPFFNIQLPAPQSSFWFKEGKKWKKFQEKELV